MSGDPLFSLRKKNGKVEEITVGACAGITLVRIVKLVIVASGGAASIRFIPWSEVFATVQAAMKMGAG